MFESNLKGSKRCRRQWCVCVWH